MAITSKIEKSKILKIKDIIGYVPNSVLIKSIIKKSTGNVSLIALDSGETMVERIIPFDTFIHIIDGKAEIMIDGKIHLLGTGEAIIIPAHSPNTIKANVCFKMISVVIKGGYEALA